MFQNSHLNMNGLGETYSNQNVVKGLHNKF